MTSNYDPIKYLHDKLTRDLTLESRNQADKFSVPTDDPRRFGHNDARDAFRHAYTSATEANRWGESIANAKGIGNEIYGYFYHEQSTGEENMDIFNNAVGRSIGSRTTNRYDIARNTYNALIRGELIIDPDSIFPASPFSENDDFYTQPLGFSGTEDNGLFGDDIFGFDSPFGENFDFADPFSDFTDPFSDFSDPFSELMPAGWSDFSFPEFPNANANTDEDSLLAEISETLDAIDSAIREIGTMRWF